MCVAMQVYSSGYHSSILGYYYYYGVCGMLFFKRFTCNTLWSDTPSQSLSIDPVLHVFVSTVPYGVHTHLLRTKLCQALIELQL